jgi:hypothetical protein
MREKTKRADGPIRPFGDSMFSSSESCEGVPEVSSPERISDYTKATGTDLDRVDVRRTLPGNRNVVSRDHFVEGSVFPFAGKVPALGPGDTHQIGLYVSDVDGCLRCVLPGGSRRTLHLPGIETHANSQSND